ncbi:MAG: chromate transporter [Oscillospiraceae bacterium]|nr:chromate transporter [Oscillospiraceae bacterium]
MEEGRRLSKQGKLWELFCVFFRVGLFTFGGGYAMISVVEDACVDRRGWITRSEMDDLVVLAEATPGPIAINCATFVGNRQGGLAGALAATFGMVLPSFLVILLISRVLDCCLEIRLIASAFRGIKLAVGVLILDAARRLLRRRKRSVLWGSIFAASLLLMLAINLFALQLSTVVLMLGAAALSMLAYGIGGAGGGAQ